VEEYLKENKLEGAMSDSSIISIGMKQVSRYVHQQAEFWQRKGQEM
jgi:hypothetical protein